MDFEIEPKSEVTYRYQRIMAVYPYQQEDGQFGKFKFAIVEPIPEIGFISKINVFEANIKAFNDEELLITSGEDTDYHQAYLSWGAVYSLEKIPDE
ncbi:MAG: hypothetical protein QXL94_00395 [Candidatus Parvarchaeum sp.]